MKWFSYKGACTAKDQIEMVETFCQRWGKEKIQAILGDREFDNGAFINYLETEGIPYVIRIKKSASIEIEEGQKVKLSALDLKKPCSFQTKLYGTSVTLDHRLLKTGEHLFVASQANTSGSAKLYKRRWDIESTFRGCKKTGFEMESTHLKHPKRLHNLVKCIALLALR